MPVLIAVAGAIVAAYIFLIRARNAAEMTGELLNVANDVRLAARRFGFKRLNNVHPVESVDDPDIATGALATAFLELDSLPTAEQHTALENALVHSLVISQQDAAELVILGHWLVNECGGAQPAVTRTARKLFKLKGALGFDPLMEIISAVATASSGTLIQRQKDALDDVKRAFQIR